MTTGVTVGKFNPFHKGHELLIEFGASMLDNLTVIVSDKKLYDIKQRASWIKAFVKARNLYNVTIITHSDADAPSYCSSEVDKNGTVLNKEYQQYWVSIFKKYAAASTHFVSSDQYGQKMSELLGIEWLPVDPKREYFKISGTAIRSNILANFQYISDYAKADFTKKVAVIGAESSGKSTLVSDLAKLYQNTIIGVPEYGRTVSEIKIAPSKADDLSNRTIGLTSKDFYNIVIGQQMLIDIGVKNSPLAVISDTEAYTTYLFSKIYLGKYLENIEVFAEQQHFDLYIVLAPTIKWVDDSYRVIADNKDRITFYNMLIDWLKANNKKFVVIEETNRSKRLNEAINHINNLF